LREICPPKKMTPKSGAVNGIITGILLNNIILCDLLLIFYLLVTTT
jgi:hypothetical protein